MTPNVSPEFAEVLVVMAEAFNATVSEQKIRLYAGALGDLTLEQVRQAARTAVRESRFFPSASELRSYVQPTGDDAGLLAWAALQQAAARVGAYCSLELEDRAAAQAFALIFGTWPTYCALEGPAIGARRLEFLAAYREARRRPPAAYERQLVQHAPVRLLGICERENAGREPALRGAWVGRITAGGEVQAVPERSHALPERIVNRLTDGG